MPDTKISGLAAKTTPASADLLVLVDVSDTTMDPAGTDKKATVGQLAAAVSTALGLGTASTHAATDFQAAGSYGTVSSVGLTVPGVLFSVAGSPVTTSGVLAFSLLTQAANTVLAGPTTGANASPTMRALVAADIPALPYAPTAGSTSIVTLGTVATGAWNATVIGVSKIGTGTPSAGKYVDGGTGAWTALPAGGSIASTSSVLKGDGSGGAVAATAGTDYPGLASANTFTAQQIFLTGASGGSPAVFRQTGGTAGTNEVQVYHDGTRGYVASRKGELRLIGADGFSFVQNSDGATRLNWNGLDTWTFVGYLVGNSRCTFPGYNFSQTSASPYLYQAADSVLGIGQGSLAGTTGAIATGSNTPLQIAANTNDYAPSPGDFQRWNASGAFNVTGMVAGQPGEKREIWNVGSNTITLTHQDAASAAANRWYSTTAASLALVAGKCAKARYDAVTQAWRVYLTS